MRTFTLELEGTGQTMVVAVVASVDAPMIASGLDGLMAEADPADAGLAVSGDWLPMSRSEATVKYPNAWDAPEWQAGHESDVERMVWLRSGLSDPLVTGFAHLAEMVPGDRITGAELSELVGFAKAGGWKSALSHAAVRARRVSRRPIWDAERVGGIWRYCMPEDVGSLWNATNG